MSSLPEVRAESFATLRLRFETKDGPRTAVVSNISLRDAALMAAAHRAKGQYAEYQEVGAIYSLADHIAKSKPKLTAIDGDIFADGRPLL